MGSCMGAPTSIGGPHANLGMLCMACCLMLKHWVYWTYQYNTNTINFIDHLHFYFCEWLCRYGPSGLLCLSSIMLLRRHCTALMWMKSYMNNRTQRVAVGRYVTRIMNKNRHNVSARARTGADQWGPWGYTTERVTFLVILEVLLTTWNSDYFHILSLFDNATTD